MNALSMMDDRSQVAWNACLQAYQQDPSLYYNSDNRKKRIQESPSRYFWTQERRTDFKVNGVMYKYDSMNSSDTIAVQRSRNQNVIAFRGTDTADPLRQLGYIPDDYEDRVLKENPDFDSLPYQTSDCGCGPPSTCPINTKNQVLEKVNNSQCSFVNPLGNTVPKDTTNSSLLYEAMGERKIIERLRAGSGITASESDCQANTTINRRFLDFVNEIKISGYTVPITPTLASLQNDPKHFQSKLHAMSIVKNSMNARKPLIICGHSLGGSLALNAFIAFNEEFKTKASDVFKVEPDASTFGSSARQCFQIGFNAALLSNWDSVLQRLTRDNPQWQQQAIHHRFAKDIVSQGGELFKLAFRGLSKYVPTITYQNIQNTTTLAIPSTPQVHGLLIFQNCLAELDFVRAFPEFLSGASSYSLEDYSDNTFHQPTNLWVNLVPTIEVPVDEEWRMSQRGSATSAR